MKNNIKIFFVLFISIFVSCEDAIDIEQPGTLIAENAFQSVDDLQLGLLGVYNQYDNTTEILFNAVYTDELAIGFDNGGQNVNQYALNLTSASGQPAAIWTNYYIALSHVNRLIAASDVIEPTAAEQDQYDNILGQAYALRAYTHLQLTTYFTTDYTNDNALGVIALDYVPALTAILPRNTNGEVYALIEADLTTANSLLSDDTSNPLFVNKDFVTAMRARMAAYRGQYTIANTYASELLTKYPLADQATFFEMFNDNVNGESIFKLDRSVGDTYDGQGTGGGGWAGSLFAFIDSTLSGSPFMEMGRSLYNELDDNDIRKSRYIDPSSVIDPDYENSPNYQESDILVIRKYPGSDNQPLMNDLKIFRSSEMLFIMAEAAADAGDYSGAAALIKQLRDARFGSAQPSPTYNTEAEAFGGILDERRLELAFEGHRWVDLKRLGVRGNRVIDRDPRDCEVNGVCSMSSTDHRFTMPIPLGEIDVDPLLEQNPNY